MTSPSIEITEVLRRLRRGIRRYLFAEGAALVILAACLLFWATFSIDWLYFQSSQLELPRWFRLASLIAMLGGLSGLVALWLGARMWRRLREDDLALALERKFPELNDRLITAVQLGERGVSPLQSMMLDRTAREAAERLSQVQPGRTLDFRPLQRMGVAAAIALATVLTLGLANAQAMERWYNAYILQQPEYWNPFRRQSLNLHVLAPPGDQEREFDDRQIYFHPRGADLTLVVRAAEGTPPPDRVTLQTLAFTGGSPARSRVTMSRLGDDEFRQTFSRVMHDQQIWLQGGDFVNRTPYRIRVVDPPQVDEIQLACEYPTYTGWSGMQDRLVRVQGLQQTLPMETRCRVLGTVNKPLRRVTCRSDMFEVLLSTGSSGSSARVTLLDSTGGPQEVFEAPALAEAAFSSDRREFSLPVWISATAGARWSELSAATLTSLPTPAETLLNITLEDDDQIISQEPIRLALSGIVDEPPVVESRRVGIGSVVTRLAQIPIEGKLNDDYGVADAWFEYRVDQAPDADRRPLTTPPRGQKEVRLGGPGPRPLETFQLLPLQLREGQALSLAIAARDGDDMNGPHFARGELFSFKVVSEEELLSRLNEREINLRQRFEQIRIELEDIRGLLGKTRPQVEALDGSAETLPELATAAQAFGDRSLHQVRKNATESKSIEVSFQDLREEMVNNRVHTEERLDRIDHRVLAPMTQLNDVAFVDLDQRIGILRLALERGRGQLAALNETAPALDSVLAQIDAILAEMRDRGTYNELIQRLQDMINKQNELLEQTESKRIEDNFFTPLN